MLKIAILFVLLGACAVDHTPHGNGQACTTCHLGNGSGALRVPAYPGDAGVSFEGRDR